MSPLSAKGSDGVTCPMCGEMADRPQDEYGTTTWICSPCRAERTGTVYVVLPAAARAETIAERVAPAHGDLGAIQAGLRTWADALAMSGQAVADLLAELRATPSAEEAVANALLGDLDPRLVGAPGGDPHTMLLQGLPPAVARRAAKAIPFVCGPKLTDAELQRVADEMGRA